MTEQVTKGCTITVHHGDENLRISCVPGMSLHAVLANSDDALIDAPCGGKGKCGKCKVKILEGSVSPVSEQERKFLSSREIEQGVRLACLTEAYSDLEISIRANAQAHIVVAGVDYDTDILPNVRKTPVQLDTPSLEDQRDDFARLKDALGGANYHMPLKELIRLPSLLRENNNLVTAVHDRNYIITIEAGDSSGRNIGVAVDIGTTTVVAYLIDLNTGKQIDAVSGLNSQKSYGQDVISRINYTLQNTEGLNLLRKRIINQINNFVWDLAERNKVAIENIYSITLVGNTTMMHLASGLPPGNIATVPFIPVAKNRMTFLADDVGLGIPKGASVYLLPSISGYVGADIVAAVLSSGLHFGEALSLLIDIGTNGEIVLGDRERMFCCSTAAGPAFEGATIRHGVGGIGGAINRVELKDSGISYSTIADQRPLGICGSGIIDVVAILLETGLVDETGRMLDSNELKSVLPEDSPGRPLLDNLLEIEDQPAVMLADASVTEHGEDIYITQKDVREVQLAKASIAAGINTLIKTAEKEVGDIDVIYLAGGFGSFIDKDNAIRIGLIPKELREKVRVIGNAAGIGAGLALISEKCLTECDRIADSAEYVEHSSSLDFQNEYVASMYFPT